MLLKCHTREKLFLDLNSLNDRHKLEVTHLCSSPSLTSPPQRRALWTIMHLDKDRRIYAHSDVYSPNSK